MRDGGTSLPSVIPQLQDRNSYLNESRFTDEEFLNFPLFYEWSHLIHFQYVPEFFSLNKCRSTQVHICTINDFMNIRGGFIYVIMVDNNVRWFHNFLDYLIINLINNNLLLIVSFALYKIILHLIQSCTIVMKYWEFNFMHTISSVENKNKVILHF